MTILEAMKERHAVRSYQDRPLEAEKVDALRNEIVHGNQEGRLSMQLIVNDSEVFKGMMAYLAGFRKVSNYIVLAGPQDDASAERLGYFGQRLALKAQQLGLNTCWVGGTFKKEKCKVAIGEQEAIMCVLAVGYGTTQGVPHQSKTMLELCKVESDMPEWFRNGMKAAMLAPTANNKQNFLIELKGETAVITVKESKLSQIDLGIVKYHFEQGAKRVL